MSGTTPPRLQSSLVEAKRTEMTPMSAASVFRSSLAAAEWGLGNLASLRLGEGCRDVTIQLCNDTNNQHITAHLL